MKAKTRSRSKGAGLILGFIAVVGLGVLGWYGTRPGPMAFAANNTVALNRYGGHPTGVPADFVENDIIARGRYLTYAADCEACHTADSSRPFAGGLAFKTPFGTLYSPNITADKETGIGAWSNAEFLQAVHDGVARNGERLYPAFPYAAYTYITDGDALAIKAYLFSLTPIKYRPPESDLHFPYNQRWLMVFWSGLFNPKQRFRPAIDRSAEWNRGAYLSEALAHCGDCHTPRNWLQALDNKNKFAGAVAEGWRAYNITADPVSGVGAWSEADLAQYLSTGHATGRGTASGPMAQAVDLSFQKLRPGDIAAIVTYLRSVPAIASSGLPAPKGEPAPTDPNQGVTAALDPRGKRVFEEACVSCHAWTGVSPLDARAILTGSRAVNDPSAINVAKMVLRGSDRQTADGTPAMPKFAAAYDDREIAAVANYVTTRFGARGSALSAQDVRKLRETQ
jgi:mono/diheme cytochrome c family protein